VEDCHKPVVGGVESVPPTLLSMGWMGHCVGIIVGEETISYVSLIIYFCWIEGVEAAVVVVVFCAFFEQTLKRMDFVV
jgi:hypothetical protein